MAVKGRHYTKDEREAKMADFIERYEKSYGLMFQTCRDVDVKPDTIKRWREKFPEFNEKINAIDEAVGDMVVGQLMKKILNGNTACIMFWLKTQRGWRETARVEVSNGNDFDVESAVAEIKNALKKK